MPENKKGSNNLVLYNTLSRKKERFKASDPEVVKIFTCGPSIYQRPHIGNYRTFVYEDILIRYLEYLDYKVKRVLVFTDIEDKAVAAAREKGTSLSELTDGIAEKYYEESKILKLKPPSYNPRSSTTVDQAVKIIKVLLKKGIAYRQGNDIFYDPLKFKGFGKLYGLDMKKWPKKKRRFKKDTYHGMRWNLGDFIIWRGCEAGEDACFDKELGMGRPSWNIQDPAMALKYLGERIDIWCGGIDNLFRHHDYNLAVAEGVTGKKYANYWLHGGHLLVDGKKMSKSLGNIMYTEHLMKKGLKPYHIRLFLMYGPYREKNNYTEEKIMALAGKLDLSRKLIRTVLSPNSVGKGPDTKVIKYIEDLERNFKKYMNNDLDVRSSFDSIFEIMVELGELKKTKQIDKKSITRLKILLRRIDGVLQVLF